jgi:hypothetical protein
VLNTSKKPKGDTKMEKIRLYDEDLNLSIAWHGGNTFNIHDGKYGEEVDCFTIYEKTGKKWTPKQAKQIICKHFEEMKEGN